MVSRTYVSFHLCDADTVVSGEVLAGGEIPGGRGQGGRREGGGDGRLSQSE